MPTEDVPAGSLLDSALQSILREYDRATASFAPMASPHEGYAVILEEVDELWREVKTDKRAPTLREDAMRREAIQVAAMALRFLIDCC